MADILIHMEMPEYCYECPCHNGESGYCQAYKSGYLSSIERPAKCPLIPLPEGHGRLGDLDALSKEFERLAFLDWNQKAAPYSWAYAYSEAQAAVDDSPTIVPAEGGENE